MIPASTVFAVALFSLVTTLSARETHTETFYPDHPVSGQTSIEIVLDTEGDILWRSDAASDVAITVTLTVDTEAQFNSTVIEFADDPGSNSVSLTIRNVNDCGSAHGWNANAVLTLLMAVLASVLVSRCSGSSIWHILTAILMGVAALQACANNCTERADVAILVPRNFTFSVVTLSSRRGSNQIDHTLIASNAALRCSSGAGNTVCESCCHGNGRCVDGGCRCKSGFQADDNCGTQRDTSYSLNTNPANPVIMTIETVDSEQLQVLGDKDEDGVASGVESIIFEDGQGNTTFVTLNANNSLMDTVTTPSGTYLHFNWNENLTEVYVTAVSPDGSIQVTVNIDLSDIDTNNRSKRDNNVQSSSSSYPSEISKTSQTKIQSKSSLTKRQSGSTAKVPVTVTRCDEPEPNAQVYANALLNYKDTSSGPQWTGEVNYMAVRTSSSGVYYVKIPTQQSSMQGEVIEEVCKKIVGIIGNGCTAVSAINPALELHICFGIAGAVDLITLPVPGDSAAVFGACVVGFRAFRLYCDTLGYSPQTGVPSLADAICNSISIADDVIDFIRVTTIHLQPHAIFPAGNRVSAVGQILEIQPGASGVLPYSFTIEDANVSPVLKLLTVTPNDPVPNENYIVSVSYICATPSVNVTMHIIGTDDYENSATCYGNSHSSCVLYVPGAEALVLDRVTITITEPRQGYSFTRQVVVIF